MDRINRYGYPRRDEVDADLRAYVDGVRLEGVKTLFLKMFKEEAGKKRKRPTTDPSELFDLAWKKYVDSFRTLTGSDFPQHMLLNPRTNEGYVINQTFAHACLRDALASRVDEAKRALRAEPSVRRPSALPAVVEAGPGRLAVPSDLEVDLDLKTGERIFRFAGTGIAVGSLEQAAWIRTFGGTKISVEAAMMHIEATIALDQAVLADMHAGSWTPKALIDAFETKLERRMAGLYALPWAPAPRAPSNGGGLYINATNVDPPLPLGGCGCGDGDTDSDFDEDFEPVGEDEEAY